MNVKASKDKLCKKDGKHICVYLHFSVFIQQEKKEKLQTKFIATQ